MTVLCTVEPDLAELEFERINKDMQ